MTQPKRPAAPDQAAEAPQSIKIESNDAVQSISAASVESVITDGPLGTVIETFMGVQENVAWAMPSATVVAPGAE
jgi:hypothetical protein